MYCLKTPASFRAVGQFHSDFKQVNDEEAQTYLSKDSSRET